jgi:pimeloyl-ACP methyl ester carboxylesterase/acyl carrier protein
MSASSSQILADLSEFVRSLSDSLLPGEEITMDTRLIEDLGLQSIALANLSGRIQLWYGAAANMADFLAERTGPISNLRVGEVVEYLAGVIDGEADGPAEVSGIARSAAGPYRDAITAADLEPAPVLSRHQPRNDNAAVLREHAEGTTRSLLRLSDGDVEVFTAGDGPPLILVHPLNVGAGVFARQFASLADKYRVICMHNPGVGATTWLADQTLSGLAQLYRAVLWKLSVNPPFHVMGSCFGGLVAQEFALLHPAECASLVLVGSSYRSGARQGAYRPLPVTAREEFDLMCGGSDQTLEGERTELEEHLLRCESMDTRIGLGYLNLLKTKPSLYARLPEIAAPTLILRGQQDTMIPAKHAHVLSGAIPNAQLAEFAGAGHFPYLTHPVEFGRVLTPFLAANSATGGPATAAAAIRPGTRTSGPPAGGDPAGPADLERCIIISTGRCGSTVLSDLIAEEPETLSVSESLIAILGSLRFTPRTMLTGAEYWALLGTENRADAHLMRAGVVTDEFAYPDSGRWGADKSALPAILLVCLPKLSADPDHLFDVLAREVPEFPAQPVGLHHRMLLDLLATMHGRRRWVERTGASSLAAYPWLATCPDARIVYLTRNVADTARSMSRHPAYQLSAIGHEFLVRYGANPYVSATASGMPEAAQLPAEMRRLLPDQLTEQTFRELDLGLSYYEGMCAQMNDAAEQALAELRPRHLHRMQYEDLVASPVDELTSVASFLGFADPSGWAARTASRVRPPRIAPAQPA